MPAPNPVYFNKSLFIEEAEKIHGKDVYDYSQSHLVNSTTHINVLCKKCNQVFKVKPWQHLYGSRSKNFKGCGCPNCANKKRSNTLTKDKQWFLNECQTRRLDKGKYYDYSKLIYTQATDKSEFICPKHGSFWQRPWEHLKGNSCPYCKRSILEENTANILKKYGINFTAQKKFNWLGQQSLDFYLPDYNIAIECQGIQHYEEVPLFKNSPLSYVKELDERKRRKCLDHGIKIRYIKYSEENIESKILKILSNITKKET